MGWFTTDIILNGKSTLETQSEAEYRALDFAFYSAAILKVEPDSPYLKNLSAATQYLPQHMKLKFNAVVTKTGEVMLKGQGSLLPTIFQNDFAHMARLHVAMTGAHEKLLVIQSQRLCEPFHIHPDFDVTVKSCNGTGVAIKNGDGIKTAGPGDTAFVRKNVSHASTDFDNPSRRTTAIYVDPEPAGMKPW